MVAARLLFPAVALIATALHGQEARTVATSDPLVSGIVRDAGGVPVPDVEIGIIRGERLQQFVTTAADGKFLLSGVTAGVVPLRIRRLGYAIQFLDVDTRDPAAGALEIVLKTVVSELDEVMIPANETRLRDFYDRRQQRASFGRFLEQGEIQRNGARYSSDLFRSVPGVKIAAGSGGGNTIRVRGCQPMLWVDGQRVFGAELDEVIQPGDIAAIEFYPSNAGVPAQYLERGNRLCGTVLVWSKNG